MELAKIQESAENYLETILILKERNGTVRSVDIAAEMGFSKPSVSVAMKNLREQECITMGADGLITLTEKGQKIAQIILKEVPMINFQEVKNISEISGDRGGGFGSTGLK